MVRANKILTIFLIFFICTITLNTATGTAAADDDAPNPITSPIQWGYWLKDQIIDAIKSIPKLVVDEIANQLGTAWDFLTDLPATVGEFVTDIANTVMNKIMLLPQTAVDTVVNLFNWLETTLYNLADQIESQIPAQFAVVALPAAAALYVTTASLIIYGFLYIYKLIPVIG